MRRLFHSLNARIVVQFTAALLLVFLVQSIVYFQLGRRGSAEEQASNLRNAAREIAVQLTQYTLHDGSGLFMGAEPYLYFSARSTRAVVWFIDVNGRIVFASGETPELSGDAYTIDEDNMRVLADRFLPGLVSGDNPFSEIRGSGNLFVEPGVRWLSAGMRVTGDYSRYLGEVQLHLRLIEPSFTEFLWNSGMVVALLIAFFAAFLINALISRSISSPVRRITDVAERVANGDFSARVPIADHTPSDASSRTTTDETRRRSRDDLTLLAETMNTMIERLEFQDRVRQDFISSVSHDLRTPLTAIGGFVEGMLDGTIPPERHEHYLNIVKNETRRLQTLVKTMFEGSTLKEERAVHQEVFDINNVIRATIAGLEAQLAAKKIDVRTDLREDKRGRRLVIGDREAIGRVVYNILNNAIRYAPQHGVIVITTRPGSKAKEIEIAIEDNGSGIPQAEWPFIFDRFYQVDKSRTAKGSGLGLFICRSILTAHGQRISVSDSELGGARFMFTLTVP